MKTIALHDEDYETLKNLKFDFRVDNMRLVVLKLIEEYEETHKLEAPA